ncbi:serine hydrolase domain-containing protein [Sphingomonas rubra]|uniref:CubicO group peptidase, beta-lactamase class C family n=1 Tax=Sphingomonas rubra TaxID=634430 RepID=A0A1I5U5R9_9SPHN|nr:serine hydrolase domain-containing protein [Sphingomonas rubra]SFP90620.1 CubicO group peptidase, beta-lactamase class C family [Sphingomonas rubra]
MTSRLLLSLLLAGAAASAQVAPPRPAPTAARLPTTQALLDGYVRDGKLAGIVVAVGAGDRPPAVVAAGRIGGPGSPAATGDSLWRIYSMTKPITGMAAMLLVEEGKIGLDDPVSKYIPAFARMRVATSPDTSLASVPATRPITIRHLLTHTAGLSYSITAKGPLLREYERLGILPIAVNATVEAKARAARPATLAAFADRVATLPLVAQPGTKWAYSVSLDVLGRVIEVASGMPFNRFLQTRFFTPLGMTSTFFTVPAAQAGRLATNYSYLGDQLVPLDPAATSVFLRPPSFPYGGAGLVSSARDYDRFLHMLLNGGTLDGVRVMKPETVRLGMSNLLPAGVFFPGAATMGGKPEREGYGAGGSVRLTDQPGGPSRGTYGWGGAAGTLAWVDPVRRVRGTIMVNTLPPRYPVGDEVGAALLKDATR